jgi:hypothetical protein
MRVSILASPGLEAGKFVRTSLELYACRPCIHIRCAKSVSWNSQASERLRCWTRQRDRLIPAVRQPIPGCSISAAMPKSRRERLARA